MAEFKEFNELFERVLRRNGLADYYSVQTSEKLFLLVSHMLQANRRMNLTAVTSVHDIIIKHYADCIACAGVFPQGAFVADIGSGAGFPALPLAVVRPDLRITAVDSILKRTEYIESAAALLELSNVTAVNERAEVMARDLRYAQSFDCVCSRAVAELRVLCELCLPLVKVGGRMIALKGKKGAEELEAARNALYELGGAVDSVYEYSIVSPSTPEIRAERSVISIYKNFVTPEKYPRKYSRILKAPL